VQEAWRAGRWKTLEDDSDVFGTAAAGAERDDDDDELLSEGQLLADAATATAQAGRDFHSVVRDMLVTGHADGHPIDNLLLEIKGYKFAQNRCVCQCMLQFVCVDTVSCLHCCICQCSCWCHARQRACSKKL
jgi:hypothetical protein